MTYHDDMKAALIKWLGKDKVVFLPGWDRKYRGIGWYGKNQKPVAMVVHHTAGAATDSTVSGAKGNRKGDNAGVIAYVSKKFSAPASNFILDRDGTVYVASVYPCWHCGEGSFKGVIPYNSLGVVDDRGHDFMLGVECVSKGVRPDFTSEMKWSLGNLANACKEASGWKGMWKRLPNHKTWAPTRKVDTRYTLASLRLWAARAAAKRTFSK